MPASHASTPARQQTPGHRRAATGSCWRPALQTAVQSTLRSDVVSSDATDHVVGQQQPDLWSIRSAWWASCGFGTLTEIDVQATLKQKLRQTTDPCVILGTCNPWTPKASLTLAIAS